MIRNRIAEPCKIKNSEDFYWRDIKTRRIERTPLQKYTAFKVRCTSSPPPKPNDWDTKRWLEADHWTRTAKTDAEVEADFAYLLGLLNPDQYSLTAHLKVTPEMQAWRDGTWDDLEPNNYHVDQMKMTISGIIQDAKTVLKKPIRVWYDTDVPIPHTHCLGHDGFIYSAPLDNNVGYGWFWDGKIEVYRYGIVPSDAEAPPTQRAAVPEHLCGQCDMAIARWYAAGDGTHLCTMCYEVMKEEVQKLYTRL